MTENYKAGFVGLIGLPNSGKSTLMNSLVGEKVSIVSDKPQTTRRRQLGLVSKPEYQAVVVDAPGLVSSKKGLHEFLHQEALDVIKASDALICVLNIDEKDPKKLLQIVELAETSNKPWMVVIHKTDLPFLHRPQILRSDLEAKGVPVVTGSSATKAEQEALNEKIMEVLPTLLPNSPAPLFLEDLYTPSTLRELSVEIIREKCFEAIHQEIPFGIAVRLLIFDESNPDLTRIYCEILVAKENHVSIVVGKKAQLIKEIGMKSRKEIQKLIGNKVFLDLKVSAYRNWDKSSHVMKELGYVQQPQA
ncbi:GTPase Era [bacterium]|nr:GTPase Era [bacterium]